MKNYIPKDKFDFDAVENLKLSTFETIKADIPRLLEWLQDMNWPVASEVAKYLAPHINVIKEDLLNILNSEDGMWKYWIILLIANSKIKPEVELVSTIKRIAEYPSKMEIEDGVNEVAKDTLERLI